MGRSLERVAICLPFFIQIDAGNFSQDVFFFLSFQTNILHIDILIFHPVDERIDVILDLLGQVAFEIGVLPF